MKKTCVSSFASAILVVVLFLPVCKKKSQEEAIALVVEHVLPAVDPQGCALVLPALEV